MCPYVDKVVWLESSKNGKYLFVVNEHDDGFIVLKIGDSDLELVGKVSQPDRRCSKSTCRRTADVSTPKQPRASCSSMTWMRRLQNDPPPRGRAAAPARVTATGRVRR